MSACSSTDPSTGGPGFEGVLAIDIVNNCNGECPEENVAGAALAQGSVWITRSHTQFNCANGGNCNIASTSVALGVVTFGDAGGLSVLDDVPAFTNATTIPWSGVDVTPDGTIVDFVYADPVANHIVYQASLAGSADAGHATQAIFGHVVGVVADKGAVIAAISPPENQNSGGDWNQLLDDGTYTGGSGGPGQDTSAAIYRVDLASGNATPAKAIPLDTMASRHMLTSDATNVYGVGGGSVWSMPRDLSTMTKIATSLPVGSGNCMNGGCQVLAPTGISVAGSAVVTAFLSATSQGGGPGVSSTISATRCQIFNGGTPIFDLTGKGCAGVAADAQYAYFAIVEQKQVVESCCGTQYYLGTTGIARISLTGATTQTPSIIPLDTNRMYGPRRFFVDDTYLYGIDPAYVLRIPKSSFK